jgi:hypothetical protein
MESSVIFKDKGANSSAAIAFFGASELMDIKLDGDSTYSQITAGRRTNLYRRLPARSKTASSGCTSSDFGDFELEGALMKASRRLWPMEFLTSGRPDNDSTLMVAG